jgi:hypothetical protein
MVAVQPPQFEAILATTFAHIKDRSQIQFVASCHSGFRSFGAYQRIKAMGFSCCNLEGGIEAWDSAKFVLEFPKLERERKEAAEEEVDDEDIREGANSPKDILL